MYVSELKQVERVCLDTDRLDAICTELGYSGGEAAICATMEDLAVLLQEMGTLRGITDRGRLSQAAEQIEGLAGQIGMTGLARVAGDVATLCNTSDDAALAATKARLRRLGETSLLAMWDRQDLTV